MELLLKTTINLQLVQNAVVQLLYSTHHYDHITHVLEDLHWPQLFPNGISSIWLLFLQPLYSSPLKYVNYLLLLELTFLIYLSQEKLLVIPHFCEIDTMEASLATMNRRKKN